MTKELSQKLAADCDDIYASLIDEIVSDILEHFVYRTIPDGNPECDEFVEYLAINVFTHGRTLKSFPDINYEAGQIARACIEDLDPAERFIIDYHFAETEDKTPKDDDIMHEIMKHMDAVLYDIGQRLKGID
ncbi:MAG: hypothetical protein IJU27_04950 [Bacteroidales bacterium]|nr:hypothetical protein [Bacteroidales bacterium]